MPGKRPARRDPSTALEYCRNTLAKRDGSPAKVQTQNQASQSRFDPAAQPAIRLRGTERLREWLNRLAEIDSTQAGPNFDAATAYLALLQSWLRINDVSWPSKGVFAADFSSGGKGRPIDAKDAKRRERCHTLRKQGKTWKEIAKEFPEISNRAQAQRTAKDYAKSYSKRTYRPDMEDFIDDAYELLGIKRHSSFDDL